MISCQGHSGDVFPLRTERLWLAAWQVVLFDAEKGSLVQKLTGHAKKVTSVSLHATKDSVKMCRDM